MSRRDLTERLAGLEARLGQMNQSEHEAAGKRALDVLHALLPDIPEVWHPVQTAPAGFKAVVDEPGVSSVDRILALRDRIEAGQMTGSDREILDALGRQAEAELRLVGHDAAGLVMVMARAYDRLDAKYGISS